MTRPVHALVLGVALSLFATASFAATVEQKGQPEQTITAMQSYGVNVPTEKGLRTVVPAGWRTYVHESITLPETMTWNPGQPWISVLGDLAEKCHAVVLVDWQDKAVYLRTVEVALDQDAKQAQVLQAATTPLPRFDVPATNAAPATAVALTELSASRPMPVAAPVTALAAAPTSAVALASAQPSVNAAESKPLVEKQVATAAVPASDVAKTLAPTEQLVSEHAPKLAQVQKPPMDVPVTALTAAPVQPAEVAQAAQSGANLMAAALTAAVPALASTNAPSVASAQAQVVVVRAVPPAAPAPVLASTVAPTLSGSADFTYEAPVALNKPEARTVAQGIANRFHLRLVWQAPDVQLHGPVTLLGNSAEEDVRLLQKALGVFSPVAFDIPTGQAVLAVRSFRGDYPDLAAQAPKRPVVVASQPGVPVVVASNVNQPVAPVVASVVIPASAPIAPVAPLAPVVAEPVVTAGDVKPLSAETAKAPELSVAQVVVPEAASNAAAVGAPAAVTPPVRSLLTADTAVPELELTLRLGEPLEVAISRFAESQLYTVDWQVQGGFKANRELTYRGKTLTDVLGQFLPALGVSADINKQEKHIVVRPADPVRDL